MTIVIQCKTIYYPEAIALRGGRIERSLVTPRYLVFLLDVCEPSRSSHTSAA